MSQHILKRSNKTQKEETPLKMLQREYWSGKIYEKCLVKPEKDIFKHSLWFKFKSWLTHIKRSLAVWLIR